MATDRMWLPPPSSINPNAIAVWLRVQPVNTNSITTSKVVAEFMRVCRSEGITPFIGLRYRNPEIRRFLTDRRKEIVRMLDSTQIMKGTKPVRLLERSVKFTNRGFELSVSVQVKITDPEWGSKLTRFKNGFNFRLMKRSAFETDLVIDPTLKIFVKNASIRNPYSWKIGYTIACPVMPDLSGISKNEEEDFVMKSLWKPLQDLIRPKKSDMLLHL